MSTASSIAGIVPGLMATSLVAHNIGEAQYGLDPKKGKKKKDAGKRMVKLGVTNLMAIPLIGASASAVNLIP